MMRETREAERCTRHGPPQNRGRRRAPGAGWGSRKWGGRVGVNLWAKGQCRRGGQDAARRTRGVHGQQCGGPFRFSSADSARLVTARLFRCGPGRNHDVTSHNLTGSGWNHDVMSHNLTGSGRNHHVTSHNLIGPGRNHEVTLRNLTGPGSPTRSH